MASTILDPVADAIKVLIADLAVTPTMKAYKWAPGMTGLDAVPAGVVDLPRVRRTGVDQAEDHLGQDDWSMEFPVVLYFDLSEAFESQARAAEVVEAFIKAVDANPTLTSTVQEAKVIDSEPFTVTDHPMAELGYRCRVETLKFF